METRSVSASGLDNSKLWSEEPEAVSRAPQGGAPSASSVNAGAQGAGGASGAGPARETPKDASGPDCTLPVVLAAADCTVAAAKRGRTEIVACIASTSAAVKCLVEQYKGK